MTITMTSINVAKRKRKQSIKVPPPPPLSSAPLAIKGGVHCTHCIGKRGGAFESVLNFCCNRFTCLAIYSVCANGAACKQAVCSVQGVLCCVLFIIKKLTVKCVV